MIEEPRRKDTDMGNAGLPVIVVCVFDLPQEIELQTDLFYYIAITSIACSNVWLAALPHCVFSLLVKLSFQLLLTLSRLFVFVFE
jgi:hypothetical protein